MASRLRGNDNICHSALSFVTPASFSVTPAKAGAHPFNPWLPAYAGMTKGVNPALSFVTPAFFFVTPAKAGAHPFNSWLPPPLADGNDMDLPFDIPNRLHLGDFAGNADIFNCLNDFGDVLVGQAGLFSQAGHRSRPDDNSVIRHLVQ